MARMLYVFTCPYCGQGFFYGSRFKRHKRKCARAWMRRTRVVRKAKR